MRLPILICIAASLSATCASVPVSAQFQGQPQGQTLPLTILQNLPQLQIGKDDLLDIAVYDSPELSGTLRVGEDGSIALPMLSEQKTIKAAGLFPAQLATRIAAELESAQLIVHPQVTVKVAEYQSRTVTVIGAVRHPISFQAFGQISLLDAIGRADGLTETAGDEIIVSDAHGSGLTHLVARVNITSLMDGKADKDNVMLHGGEEVRIPEEGRISVLGDVKHPGVFPVKSSSECSVLMLLARSEGTIPNASDTAFIYRAPRTGDPKQELPVDLKRILGRKAPDMHLEPGDILYIPDNHARRVTLSVLEHLSTVAGGAAAALIYAGAH